MEISRLYDIFLSSGGISTDTRSLAKDKGQIFLALSGENFDGHDYVDQAISFGACIAVVKEDYVGVVEENKLFRVSDTLTALQRLATFHREKLGIPVVAIAGSNGKTTTKNLAKAVLEKKFSVCATEANDNNHIGVPLTLLRAAHDTDIILLELGTNHPGEMQILVDIAKPSHGIITNIGEEHLEFFGDIEGVKQEEFTLFVWLKDHHGLAFVNMDDPDIVTASFGINSVTYGSNAAKAMINLGINVDGFVTIAGIETGLFGYHNAVNAHAAIAIGSAFGVDLEESLAAVSEFKPKDNRSEVVNFKEKNLVLVLDGYNANPSSMKVALKAFSDMRHSEKIVILSEMLEMGDARDVVHAEVYQYAKQLHFAEYYFVGEVYNNLVTKSDKYFTSTQELLDSQELEKIRNAAVLVKGSKGTNIRFIRKVWEV